MKFNNHDNWMIAKLVEDNGVGEGGGDDYKAEQQDTAPAYFSQFKKENREKYKDLAQYKSLDELAEVALKGHNAKEPDYTGYLKMPTEESTKEDIREFLTALGVPSSSEEYSVTLDENEKNDPLFSGMAKAIKEASFRAGLTDKQAVSMYGVFKALTDTAIQKTEKDRKVLREGFDERYSRLFSSHTQKTQQDEAIKESLGYFTTFLTETGIGKRLEETGLLYDENVVKALSDYQKKVKGSYKSGQGGNGSDNNSGRGIKYSDEFIKQYGNR